MTGSPPKTSSRSGEGAAFSNTLWSRVYAAGQSDPARAAKALEELCRLYWYPLYAFLRRGGHDAQAARDLTQSFFHYLLKDDLLQKADPTRGRFRSFLLGTLKNFVSHEQGKEQAQRRGGGAQIVSIDEENAEGQYAHEPASELTPERIFDRRWALTVLGEAMRRLESDYARANLTDLFVALQPYLSGDEEVSFVELGARLGRSEGASRTLVCRFRERFRQLIRAVIGDTVGNLEQVEIELKHLQEALRAG